MSLFFLLACAGPDPAGDFATNVHPFLERGCGCHGASKNSSESADGAFGQPPLGPAYRSALDYVTPGEPELSRLYLVLLPTDEYAAGMPPLAFEAHAQADIDAVYDWIAFGAVAD